MKHGIIGDNLKAFLGGYAGTFVALFKPFFLDTTTWFREGVLIGCAIAFLKVLGLAITSLVAGGCTALGADIVKNWSSYANFKNKIFKKTKKNKDDNSQTPEADDRAA